MGIGKVHYQVRENDVTTSYGYDGRGMIDSVSHRNASEQSLAYREYWRDDRDRITAWKRGSGGLNGMEDGRGDRYGYDEEGQLTSASYRVPNPEPGGTPGPSLRTDIFHYDELGNREGSNYLASRGEVNFTRKNNGLNQYSGWTSVINYDDDIAGWGEPGRANGVMMMEGWISASFNALNQPMAMWSPVYNSSNFMWFGYDPLGRCVKRWISPLIGGHAPPPSTNPATYYYYDGWNMVQEGSSGNSADRVYVHGGRVDEIVASEAGGQWVFHHYDAQGNCIMLTNAIGGGIQEQYDYDAFGFPYFYNAAGGKLGGAYQWGNRFLFTGREWLQDLRIYDFRARQYHPELGRFLQPDPKQFKAGDYNLYRYCHNDPVNNSDPTGQDLFPDPASFGRAVAVGTAFRIQYAIQKIQGNAPEDDKALHQQTSQLMTEIGDPFSAMLLGLVQEIYPNNPDSHADLAANVTGIKEGVISQLKSPLESPVSKIGRLVNSLFGTDKKHDKSTKSGGISLPTKDDDKAQ